MCAPSAAILIAVHAEDSPVPGRTRHRIARIMAMETLSITEAKNRFTEIANRAAAEHDHFTVTRNGHPHVMVVSVAEWDELQETVTALSDPEARADLAESAEAAQRGDFTTEEEMQAILDTRLRRDER
jgi:antitoxin YefM